VENFRDFRIGENFFQVRRVVGVAAQLDDVGVAVAFRELDEAERVARRVEAEGFRINRDAAAMPSKS
jgi:hypothetical protein